MGKKLTYSFVMQYVEEMGYDIISETYINNNTKLDMICPKGHEYSVTFSNFKNHHTRCRKCSNDGMSKDRRHSFEYVENFIESHGYVFLSENYGNNHEKILVRCTEEHEYRVSFSNFKAGKRCSICELSGRSKRNRHPIEKIIEELSSYEYTLLSDEYINARTKIKVACPEGHRIFITMGHFHNGRRCPICVLQPKGETRVQEFLEYNEIPFSTQVKFEDCKDKRHLSFDFYLEGHRMAIEVQGRQHYESVEYFGGVKSFKSQKRRDKIKRRFCEENGIQLIEIAYWEVNITEEILTQELYY